MARLSNKKALDLFLTDLTDRGLSSNTIENYKYDLNLFFAKNKKHLSRIKPIDIEGFRARQREHGLSPSTINRRLISLSRLFTFLEDRGYITGSNPVQRKHKVKVSKTLPKPLTGEEIGRLIEVIPDDKVKLMVLMMVKCGLRISEVIKLKIKDVNFTNGVIHVIGGKGAKDRNVSLPSDVKDKLQEYLKSREMITDVEEVFLNKYAKAYSNYRSLWSYLKKHMRKLELQGTPHSLRHSFATILVSKDIPIVEVQALMGHSDIKTTMKYVKVVQKKAMESQIRVMEGIQF